MQLTYLGHACFKLEAENGYTVVIDPYVTDYVPGLDQVQERADAVLCTHEHKDHAGREQVTLCDSGVQPITVKAISCWHDEVQGAKRGANTIFVLEADGVKAAHFGDLGGELTPEQLAQLQGLDVAMIPVGGFYTIDGKGAAALMQQLNPRIVVPMHYRSVSGGYDVLDTVEGFVNAMGGGVLCDSDTITVEAAQPARVLVLRQRNAR